ncbi:MAG: hypothetical protein PUC26_01655 [Eubacteriales bacterium]|nr:hypothetical protein [Eubacteriales bacterium]
MITGLFIFLYAEVGFHLPSCCCAARYRFRIDFPLHRFFCTPAAFAQRGARAEGKTPLYRPAAQPVLVQFPTEWKNMVILTQERQVMQRKLEKPKTL